MVVRAEIEGVCSGKSRDPPEGVCSGLRAEIERGQWLEQRLRGSVVVRPEIEGVCSG